MNSPANTSNLVDFDTGMVILDAITTTSDAGKRKLAELTAAVELDGRTWVDADAGCRGDRSAVRKLLRDGLLTKNARRQGELEFTDLGRAVAKATADDGDSLANDHAADRLERSYR